MGPAERIKRIMKIGLLFSNEISPSVPLLGIYSTVKSPQRHIYGCSQCWRRKQTNKHKDGLLQGTVGNRRLSQETGSRVKSDARILSPAYALGACVCKKINFSWIYTRSKLWVYGGLMCWVGTQLYRQVRLSMVILFWLCVDLWTLSMLPSRYKLVLKWF